MWPEIWYMHIYSNCSLNTAQTTQYPTSVVYQTSFSSDSCQEIVWYYYSSRNMQDVYQQIYMDYMLCEGLPDGVAFVVKHKKFKTTWKIMHAFQFSTIRTMIDAFPDIRSKVAINVRNRVAKDTFAHWSVARI